MTTKINLNLLDYNKFYEISKGTKAFAGSNDFLLLTWMMNKQNRRGGEKEQCEVSMADFQEFNIEELKREFPLLVEETRFQMNCLRDCIIPLANMCFIDLLFDSNNAQNRVRYRINVNQLNRVLA